VPLTAPVEICTVYEMGKENKWFKRMNSQDMTLISSVFPSIIQECCIAIPLSQVVFIEEQAAGIGKR